MIFEISAIYTIFYIYTTTNSVVRAALSSIIIICLRNNDLVRFLFETILVLEFIIKILSIINFAITHI